MVRSDLTINPHISHLFVARLFKVAWMVANPTEGIAGVVYTTSRYPTEDWPADRQLWAAAVEEV